MTETQCREALLAFVAENCCYGKKAAEDMKITEVQPTTALHVSPCPGDLNQLKKEHVMARTISL